MSKIPRDEPNCLRMNILNSDLLPDATYHINNFRIDIWKPVWQIHPSVLVHDYYGLFWGTRKIAADYWWTAPFLLSRCWFQTNVHAGAFKSYVELGWVMGIWNEISLLNFNFRIILKHVYSSITHTRLLVANCMLVLSKCHEVDIISCLLFHCLTSMLRIFHQVSLMKEETNSVPK